MEGGDLTYPQRSRIYATDHRGETQVDMYIVYADYGEWWGHARSVLDAYAQFQADHPTWTACAVVCDAMRPRLVLEETD